MKNTPPAKCRRAECDEPSIAKDGRALCAQHNRLSQMRYTAKSYGKAVPTMEDLDKMIPAGMICPDCGKKMNWLAKDGGYRDVACLQHYRSGEMAIVCMTCNTRHAHYPGDAFRGQWRENKWCPGCKTVLPRADFWLINGRTRARCKECERVRRVEWVAENRDAINKRRRAYKARKRATQGRINRITGISHSSATESGKKAYMREYGKMRREEART